MFPTFNTSLKRCEGPAHLSCWCSRDDTYFWQINVEFLSVSQLKLTHDWLLKLTDPEKLFWCLDLQMRIAPGVEDHPVTVT